MPNVFYPWNKHSDQPRVLRNKAFKRQLYLRGAYATVKTLLTSLYLPFFSLVKLSQRRVIMGTHIDCFGLCVNPDYPLPEKISPTNEQLRSMVEDLGVTNLLIRFPLGDYDHKEKYFEFIRCFDDKRLLINILQDRDHIENPSLTEEHLREIFSRLCDKVEYFQIGNSINRRKWAFISQDEYFQFFQIAQKLKKQEFPQLKLIGSNIIDFELPNFMRSLIHWWPINYDGVAAQLYVDRRGAPENKQLGCDTISKINWFAAVMRFSHKTQNSLWITETNWPLEDTSPFSPAIGECMVSEAKQTTYLVRYYLLAIASGRVKKCFWHQLVAPGYGLVDNRGSELRIRDAFYSYKNLIALMEGGKTLAYSEKDGLYRLKIETPRGIVEAVWVNDRSVEIPVTDQQQVLDIFGNPVMPSADFRVTASDDVIYLLDKKG